MKMDVMSRHEFTEDDLVIIDASAHTVEDLYNNFERTYDYIKKDLDQDFVDYLICCVREIQQSRLRHKNKPKSERKQTTQRESARALFSARVVTKKIL